jgi:cyclopropane fatty-acyl-phospholipid synthase-like methyltransferase
MTSDHELEAARYTAMHWNTPLSEAHADALVERLDISAAESVLDLGCGWAELLIRILQRTDTGCTGIGVDTDGALLERAAASIAHSGLEERVSLEQLPVTEWATPADRVICIGASHAWGGTTAALQALRTAVNPGGRLLFGDGCWERKPTAQALAIFGEDVLPLAELIEQALDVGWRLLNLSTADQREWDDFESSWRRGREEWLLAHPEHPRAAEIRQQLDDRLREYVNEYRRVLGFSYLVLAR